MAQESTELRRRVISKHFRRYMDIFNRQVRCPSYSYDPGAVLAERVMTVWLRNRVFTTLGIDGCAAAVHMGRGTSKLFGHEFNVASPWVDSTFGLQLSSIFAQSSGFEN